MRICIKLRGIICMLKHMSSMCTDGWMDVAWQDGN